MKDRLRQIRTELNMTQTEFGEATGKGRGTVTSYEIGRVIPDDSYIMLVAQKFGYNAEWIKTGTGDPKRPASLGYNLGAMYAQAAHLDPEEIRARLIEVVKDMPPERIVAMWQLWKTSKYRRPENE